VRCACVMCSGVAAAVASTAAAVVRSVVRVKEKESGAQRESTRSLYEIIRHHVEFRPRVQFFAAACEMPCRGARARLRHHTGMPAGPNHVTRSRSSQVTVVGGST